MDAELFKLGMRRLLSGISLVTTEYDAQPFGLIATSVSSLAADPPSLIVSINRSASSHDPLVASRVFCVNLLCASQGDLVAKFSTPARRTERFLGDDWMRGENGAPVFKGSLASFECRVTDVVPKYTHTIFIGAVDRCIVHPDSRTKPLAYFDGQYA
jgi:flavin reductase